MLAPFLTKVLYANDLQGGEYVEPYAGGASAALQLLFGEHVERIWINDADFRIYAIWQSILSQTARFEDAIMNVPLTVEEWKKQKEIYLTPNKHSLIKVGFATFYLNRCNRSGIIMNAGPIGGSDQSGNYKIDARFNRTELALRVRQIAENRTRITTSNKDALEILSDFENQTERTRRLVYLDPPYYVQGGKLYLNSYKKTDHATVAELLRKGISYPWIMTYDNVPEIRDLYIWACCRDFDLKYSAYKSRIGNELLIAPESLAMPQFDTICHRP